MPENAVRFQEAFGKIDLRDSLGKLRAPANVFHAREDRRISIGQGRGLAIANAEFVPLERRNHVLSGHAPVWSGCVAEATAFTAKHGI